MEKLYSKRNSVFRFSNDANSYVLKKFNNRVFMTTETAILEMLLRRKVKVPKIISVNNDEIVLEDLGDLTFLDWLESEEKNNSSDYHYMIIQLLSFFRKFYETTLEYYGKQYILNDVNLRNFLIRDNIVYGIDFEMCKEGSLETDIGKLLAYIITYNPIATDWKYGFINDLLHIFTINFNLNPTKLVNEFKRELYAIISRRKLKLNQDCVKSIICRIAEEII